MNTYHAALWSTPSSYNDRYTIQLPHPNTVFIYLSCSFAPQYVYLHIHLLHIYHSSFKFLGIHITDKLNWSTHTDSVVKKAQQRLFNLRRLK
jgi:hypothetical protein